MRADSSSEITARPQPTEEEIQFILDAIAEYLTVEVRRSDVQSAWSGLRPLAIDPNAKDTASASRDHIVTQDPDGLITVTGLRPHFLHQRGFGECFAPVCVHGKKVCWTGASAQLVHLDK